MSVKATSAQRAFESTILMLLGSWLIWTVFLFSDGTAECGKFINEIRWHFTDNQSFPPIPWQSVFILLLISLVSYWVYRHLQIFCRINHERFIITSGIYLLASGILLGKFPLLWLMITVVLWGFGALLFDRSVWKSTLAYGGTLTALSGIIYQICRLIIQRDIKYFCGPPFAFDIEANLPLWSGAGLILLAAWVLSSGWQYCSLARIRYREIFTLPVKIIASVSLSCYIIMVVSSLDRSYRCQTEITALERQFDLPLNAETLNSIALGNKTVDGEFWEKVEKLYDSIKDFEASYPLAEFPPEKLDAWRKKFHTTPQYAELDQMLSQPLPEVPLNYTMGNMLFANFSNFSIIRQLVRYQLWHIRFAVEKNDRAAVLSALQKIDNLSEYLSSGPFAFHALIKNMVDSHKNQAIAQGISVKIFTEDDLMALKKRSQTLRANLTGIENRVIWGELLWGMAEFHIVANGNEKFLAWKKFRFILPQCWLIYESNRYTWLKFFRNVEKCHDMAKNDCRPERIPAIFEEFAYGMMPSYKALGNRFQSAALQQQMIEFFIDQELHRIHPDKYPANPKLPIDPFTQKPMLYYQGKITIRQEYYRSNDEKEITITGRQLTSPPQTERKTTSTITVPERSLFLPPMLKK